MTELQPLAQDAPEPDPRTHVTIHIGERIPFKGLWLELSMVEGDEMLFKVVGQTGRDKLSKKARKRSRGRK